MIVVDLEGRLGNQMFQYAFAQNVAKKKNTRFLLNPVYNNELVQYFTLDVLTHGLYSRVGLRLNSFLLKKILTYQMIIQNGWQNQVKIEDNIHYKGFFQSESFFQENRNIVVKSLSIKRKWTDLFQEKYGELFSKNKTLVIHLRRTDYIDYGSERLGGKNLCLPITYYTNSLSKVNNLDDYTIICISDDIEFAREHLPREKEIFFESNNVIIDFQLMLNADIVIMANSSFAWWAGYLNSKSNKIIFSPKYWLGFKKNVEYPLGITSSQFVPVEVY